MDQEKHIEWLRQENWRKRIVAPASSQWIDAYLIDDSEDTPRQEAAIFSAFVPLGQIEHVLKDTSWDIQIGTGGPDVCTCYRDDQEVAEYLPHGGHDGIEPLVLKRDFPGRRDSYIEIKEEFRLWHNLAADRDTDSLVKVTETGEEETVVKLEPNRVRVNLKHLMQFLAVKQVAFVQLFECLRFSEQTLVELGVEEARDSQTTDNTILSFSLLDSPDFLGEPVFSRLLGKRVIRPSQSLLDAIADPPSTHQKFIITVDENGENIEHTCDPDELANNFGKNPSAPDYLTPVFFEKKVLQKYYSEPSLYSVRDGRVDCKGCWGMAIDNNHESHVVAFLGDLGRDLPEKEQRYWRSFNVAHEGTLSETEFRRSILAEFTDAEALDLWFRAKYQSCNSEWEERFAWPLYKSSAPEDSHLLETVRVPLSEDQSEFDAQVLSLAKLLVDSLNEKAIARAIKAEIPRDSKGLAKLELFLAEHMSDPSQAKNHTTFLRMLQDLRSSLAAHRKSSKRYKKIATAVGLRSGKFKATFERLLTQSIAFLDFMETVVPVKISSDAEEGAHGE